MLASVAGCSSTRGCRSCNKAVAPATVIAPTPLPVASTQRFGGQTRCPVTGEVLGSMGDPVAVTVGGRAVYVCCRGCAKRAEADPIKTLAVVEAERAAK